jgi:hypothetical protein
MLEQPFFQLLQGIPSCGLIPSECQVGVSILKSVTTMLFSLYHKLQEAYYILYQPTHTKANKE